MVRGYPGSLTAINTNLQSQLVNLISNPRNSIRKLLSIRDDTLRRRIARVLDRPAIIDYTKRSVRVVELHQLILLMISLLT